jgi:hypothetical protein
LGAAWKCWETAKDVEQFIERNSFYSGHVFGVHGEIGYGSLNCEKDFLSAYNACSPLKSLISKRSSAFNSGIIQVTNSNTGKEVKSGKASEIRKLLKRPNILQTESQFMAQQNHYVDIFGYCPVLKVRPAGMPESISSIWNIPPWLFDIEYTKKWLRQARIEGIYKSYFLNWEGERIEIPFKGLFFIFDNGIGTECDTNLTIPDSRLVGNDLIVYNIIAAYKARNTLITKRGAIGILSNEAEDASGAIPMRAGEKEDLQKDFKKYGLVGQAYQIIVTDAQLKWQQMGFATKDLMLLEEVDAAIGHLCDTYGVPTILMATAKVGTYENQNQARKDFITNTIIPESANRMEQLSNGLIESDRDYEEGGKQVYLIITRDYSKLAVMQEDKVQAATARKTLNEALQIEYLKGLITKNDWREKLGEERIDDDPTFDEYYNEIEAEERKTAQAVTIATAKGSARNKLSAAA